MARPPPTQALLAPPLPLPLPPLDEPLVAAHSLEQLCSTHDCRAGASLMQVLDAVQLPGLAPAGHAHENAPEQLEFTALTWELQLVFKQLTHAELPEMPNPGQLVAE